MAAFLFWLFTWLNPVHYPSWVVFQNETSAFVAVLLGILALHLAAKHVFLAQAPRLPALAPLWLLSVSGAVALQFSFGLNSLQQAYMGMLYLAALGLAFVLGSLAYTAAEQRREDWEAYACLGLLYTGLLSAGIVLSQYFRVEDAYPMLAAPRGSFRPFGNLGQPNNEATFLAMSLVCLDVLVRRRRITLSTAVLALGVIIPALAATDSRAGVLGAVSAACYLLIFGTKPGWRFTLGWLASLLALFLLMPEVNRWLDFPSGRSTAEIFADNPRLLLYGRLLQSLTEHAWLGYGFGNTGEAQSLMALRGYVGVPVTNAHNLVLDFLIWFGVPLGMFLTVSFVVWAVMLWRESPVRLRPLYGVPIPFLVHSLVELPYAYSFFLLTFGVVAGYLATAAPHRRALPWSASRSLLLGLSVALMGTVAVYDYIHSMEEYTIARFEHRKVGSVPLGHVPYEPLLLTDIGGQLSAIRIAVVHDLDPQKIQTLNEQALRHHIALPHIKLISYYLHREDMGTAEDEIRRYRNLYAYEPKVLSWGSETLQTDFCPRPGQTVAADRACALIRAYFQ